MTRRADSCMAMSAARSWRGIGIDFMHNALHGFLKRALEVLLAPLFTVSGEIRKKRMVRAKLLQSGSRFGQTVH